LRESKPISRIFIAPSPDRGKSNPRACDIVKPPSAWCTKHQLAPVSASVRIDASATTIRKPFRPRAVRVRVGFVDAVT
jgi:hypothetical protein